MKCDGNFDLPVAVEDQGSNAPVSGERNGRSQVKYDNEANKQLQ
jgi:hypothetical protein